MPPPEKRHALVTGASGGIGLGVARELARRGWNLTLTARSGDLLARHARQLRDRHGIAVEVVALDLAQAGATEALYTRTEGAGRSVGLLVNNAGIGYFGPFVGSDPRGVEATIQVNITVLTSLTRRFVEPMVDRGAGRILNVASTAAFQPGPLLAVYYASKAYVVSFSEALREELRGTGVTVTALCPGPTRSGFQERAGMEQSALFNRFAIPDSDQVGRFGVEAALRGRGIAVHGPVNRLVAASTRLVPRGWLPAIVRRIQEQRA
ncbi:MAG: SDR family oxidoreductase [Gemmatimonadales bacterium]|nr:MAG: SDR family oxidoreductase [Gemmatimonadales bacterium]